MPAQYGIVLTTAASRTEAEAIAQVLVSERLAACVSLLPIHSVYTWQGKLEQQDEWQLLIKTDLTLFPSLESKIRELHSYDVPELIALPLAAGSTDYLDWIGQSVRIGDQRSITIGM
ncbi:MAG: divalent-cation tolerance protein CutA [Cyanobacteria bacterium J069]|nr:MAG: divalent-cation tolerance protein CutA [Cyanobacteria bacterium J069]